MSLVSMIWQCTSCTWNWFQDFWLQLWLPTTFLILSVPSTYWSFIATPFPFFRPLLISHHVFIVILCKNLWLFLILFFLHAMLISVIGARSSVLQLFCLHCFERFFFSTVSNAWQFCYINCLVLTRSYCTAGSSKHQFLHHFLSWSDGWYGAVYLHLLW